MIERKENKQGKFKFSEGRAVHSLIWVSREREQGRCTLGKLQLPYATRYRWRNTSIPGKLEN